MKFSSQAIELEYLLSAHPSEVLKYLDARGQEPYDEALTPEILTDAMAKALLDRNDRTVDIAIARVCSSTVMSAIIERHLAKNAVRQSNQDSNTPDSSVMIAALSNTRAVSFLKSSARWLERWHRWLAYDADSVHLWTLFDNPKVPHDLVRGILERSGPFAEVTRDRNRELLYGAIRSMPVRRPPDQRAFLPDITAIATIEASWGTLLIQDPADSDMVTCLIVNMEDFQSLSVPRSAYDALGLPKDADYRQAYRRFLEVVFARWSDSEDESSDWPFTKAALRELIASKASFFQNEVDAYLREHPDVFVRRGYYRSFEPKNLDEIRKLYEKDGRHFTSAAIYNDYFHVKWHQKAAQWLLERLREVTQAERLGEVEPKDAGPYSDQRHWFDDILKRKHAQTPSPDRFANIDEIWALPENE